MNIDNLINTFFLWLPSTLIVLLAIVTISSYRKILLNPKRSDIVDKKWGRQFFLLLIIIFFLVALFLGLPISEGMKGQLFNLLGIALTATIALSSTTFVGNTMAGFMLKAIDSIKPGDFLRVGDHFGRVSEQGLLHTEIQTEHRDLTTLPNLFLVTTPITVVRSSGTVISATMSLGYDVPRSKIESLLLKACENVGLTDSYVRILELGDFSVTYQISGFLRDVKYLLSYRSKLKGAILDVLHEAGIEIVSPNFVNQRVFDSQKNFIPSKEKNKNFEENKTPEDLIFDKAEEAYSKDKINEMITENVEKLEALKKIKETDRDSNYQSQVDKYEKRKEYLEKILDARSKE